jgi:hypothetical protein
LALKKVVFGTALIVVLSVSLFVTIKWLSSVSDLDFYMGVEFAYSDDVSDLKALVDKVRDYTNLFVIGSLPITFNQTTLDEACDYIVDAGLHLIVFFTDSTVYNFTIAREGEIFNYTVFNWMQDASVKYGSNLLGVYRYDEPGGNQLDRGAAMMVKNATDYANAAELYTWNLGIIVEYYLDYAPRLFTADYGLYWFDYEAGYNAVFAEFGWNHSRNLNIALCRGAAEAHNKDWGAIITWENTIAPYIESADKLYEDMVLAYKNGAKYVVVFNYPKIEQYGIFTEDHFEAIRNSWDYVKHNPRSYGADEGEAAYVLPENYGFAFRSPDDKIWGLWESDELSQKVWEDANTLMARYGSNLDIVYNNSEVIDAIRGRYGKLFFWNDVIE